MSRVSASGGGAGPHLVGGTGRHVVVTTAVAACVAAATGCSPETYTCDPYCDNPIDRIVVPKLRAIGVAPRDVDRFEHCRRIAIDMLGRNPSGSEIEACMNAAPRARVELAQSHPDYVRTTRRVWSELLAYDVLETWNRDLFDLDAVVARYAAGELDYAGFVKQVVVHPGFLDLHSEDQWAAALYRVFLGRPARDDEVAALRPLNRAFYSRFLCEGVIWFNLFEGYREDGETVAEATASADIDCADAAKLNTGFNPCLCEPDDGYLGCSTAALGVPVTLPAACVDPSEPYDEANVYLIGASQPGTSDECPDGSRNPRCRDRAVDDDFLTLYPIIPWPEVGPAERAALDGIGGAMEARGDFWEAAVDRELRRLTGWWQTSFRHPDSDLPAVRAVLADMLRDGTPMREIQTLIMTSQLYAAPASTPNGWDVDDDGDPPPWAMGPTKLLAAEAWVDTMMLAVGEQPGSCDVRNLTVYGFEYELADPRLVDDPTSSLDGVAEEYYLNAVASLGGCKSGSPRPTRSNVGMVFAQGEHARIACAYGDEAVPPGWNGDLGAAADHLIRRLFARPPSSEDEIDELVGEMEACLGAGACGDPDAAARWLCQRLADSTEFATY
jgi:hypothetical protein